MLQTLAKIFLFRRYIVGLTIMAGNNFQFIKKICKSLGENNKPTYVVMSIAAVKGICRPTFTMMDKTENPETKKYTALREGLTEVIAIPAYWTCGELSGKIAQKVFKGTGLEKRAATNLMFMGVCAAALFVIPGLCSIVIKPIMDALGLKNPEENKKSVKKTDITIPSQMKTPEISTQPLTHINTYPTMKAFTTRPQTGLKVGGL